MTTSNRSAQPGRVEHLAGVARRRHHGDGVPRAGEVVEAAASEPGYGRDPVARAGPRRNDVVLAVAERAARVRGRAGRRGRRRAASMPRDARNERTPSNRGLPST